MVRRTNKQDIRNFTLAELEQALAGIGQPRYRAEQIFFWLYQRGCGDFAQMGNIPGMLKERLARAYEIGGLELSRHLKSSEGAEKFVFKTKDANFIETVLISTGLRKTICCSSQVGCKFACIFCASGRNGFIRDLRSAEILNQILYLQYKLKQKITNYVFMGMGEPLDNYNNVEKAIIIMNERKGMNIGARRITLSTCGIIPGMERLKRLGLQVDLSVSLNATDNKLRDELMPINKRYPIEKLIRACEGFSAQTKRIITLEYILIAGRNDSLPQAQRLAGIARRLKAKINLIPCSNVAGLNLSSPSRQNINKFMYRLARAGVKATFRKSKGGDIQAACGQLAGHKEG